MCTSALVRIYTTSLRFHARRLRVGRRVNADVEDSECLGCIRILSMNKIVIWAPSAKLNHLSPRTFPA